MQSAKVRALTKSAIASSASKASVPGQVIAPLQSRTAMEGIAAAGDLGLVATDQSSKVLRGVQLHVQQPVTRSGGGGKRTRLLPA